MIDGYVALPVNVEGTDGANPTKDQLKAVQDTIKEGTDAKLTSNGKVSPTGTIDMGWKFTGITFIDSQNELLAEVVVYPKNI